LAHELVVPHESIYLELAQQFEGQGHISKLITNKLTRVANGQPYKLCTWQIC